LLGGGEKKGKEPVAQWGGKEGETSILIPDFWEKAFGFRKRGEGRREDVSGGHKEKGRLSGSGGNNTLEGILRQVSRKKEGAYPRGRRNNQKSVTFMYPFAEG